MEYVVEEGIIWSIKVLYDGSMNSILLDSSVGKLFPSMDGVWQDCLMSLVLFNIYLEKKSCAIHSRTIRTSVSIRGMPHSNLHFADINLMAGSNNKLHNFNDKVTASMSTDGNQQSLLTPLDLLKQRFKWSAFGGGAVKRWWLFWDCGSNSADSEVQRDLG